MKTFERTWKNAILNPPTESNRYWCFCEEQTDLGMSHYQLNCSYNEFEKRWSNEVVNCKVLYWVGLAPNPL
jgi:hypothetical protein